MPTSQNLKSKIQGVEQRLRMLVPIFQNHNDKLDKLVGQEFAPGTLLRYKTSLSHTIEFLQLKFKVSRCRNFQNRPLFYNRL